jgi:four helix bundle protein
MARVERFEDLIAWQKARVLTCEVHRIARDGPLSRDFELSRQMRRAAVSIMANIAEGFERRSPAEFAQFLNIAKASCAELRSLFYVAMDARHWSSQSGGTMIAQAEEVSRILSGLHASVQARRKRATQESQ